MVYKFSHFPLNSLNTYNVVKWKMILLFQRLSAVWILVIIVTRRKIQSLFWINQGGDISSVCFLGVQRFLIPTKSSSLTKSKIYDVAKCYCSCLLNKKDYFTFISFQSCLCSILAIWKLPRGIDSVGQKSWWLSAVYVLPPLRWFTQWFNKKLN